MEKIDWQKLQNRKSVPALIKLLDHPNPEIRSSAARSLGKIKDERAIPALLKRINDDAYDDKLTHFESIVGDTKDYQEEPNPTVGQHSMDALRAYGKRAESALIEVLKTETPINQKVAALEMLRDMNSKKAERFILQLIHDESIKHNVYDCLSKLGTTEKAKLFVQDYKRMLEKQTQEIKRTTDKQAIVQKRHLIRKAAIVGLILFAIVIILKIFFR